MTPLPTPTSNPMQPAVSSVGQLVSDLTTKVTGVPQEPSDALKDLRLSQSLMEMLTPPLKALNYTIEHKDLIDPFSKAVCSSCTVVKNNAGSRALCHIPKWILDDPNPPNTNAVIAMGYWLEQNTTLIILSEGLDTPARPYRKIAEGAWSKYNSLKTSFVPWRDITDLNSKSLDELRVRLIDILQLEELEQAAAAAAAAPQPPRELNLTGPQLAQLQKAMLSAFPSEGKLKQMIFFQFSQELSAIAGGSDLTEIVFNLILWAKREGHLYDLIKAGRDSVPDNQDLKNFAQSVGLP